jgi:hypothetical protein
MALSDLVGRDCRWAAEGVEVVWMLEESMLLQDL